MGLVLNLCLQFTFMGIEGIADEIEMPFGRTLRRLYRTHMLTLAQAWTGTISLSVCVARMARDARHTLTAASLDRYCADLKEEIECVHLSAVTAVPYVCVYHRYLLERLPEGGEGMYGFDDGEGDD
jgi:putative membrane protein